MKEYILYSTNTISLHKNEPIETLYVYVYTKDELQCLDYIRSIVECVPPCSTGDGIYNARITVIYVIFITMCCNSYETIHTFTLPQPLDNMICFISMSNKIDDMKVKYLHTKSTFTENNIVSMLKHRKLQSSVFVEMINILLIHGVFVDVDQIISFLIYTANGTSDYDMSLVYTCLKQYRHLIHNPHMLLKTAIERQNCGVIKFMCKQYINVMPILLDQTRQSLFFDEVSLFWSTFWNIILCFVNTYDIRSIISSMILRYIEPRRIDLIFRLVETLGWNRLQYASRYGCIHDVMFHLSNGDDPRIFNMGTPSPFILAQNKPEVYDTLKKSIYQCSKYPFLCCDRFRRLMFYTLCLANRVCTLPPEIWYYILTFYDRNDHIKTI